LRLLEEALSKVNRTRLPVTTRTDSTGDSKILPTVHSKTVLQFP